MDEIDPVPDHVLRRLPGLFRRWELSQIIEAGKDYRLEDAGSACDGTTLYAVYVSTPVAAEVQVETADEPPLRPRSTLQRSAGGDASLALRPTRPAR